MPFSSLEVRREARARDGTVKALFATADGRPVEAVLMRIETLREVAPGRRSIASPLAVGVPADVHVLRDRAMRFARNLSASEILDQALHFRRIERVDHCVFMGMGEPLMNLDAVLAACERLPDLGITHRRTAISTVGWIPGIERLTECELPLRLALSLHAADEALRTELMPVNERYPLRDVLEACRAHYARKRRRIFVEYVMLAGVNDRYEQAVALAKLLRAGRTRSAADVQGQPDPLQPHGGSLTVGRPGSYRGSSREAIAAFRAALEEHGVQATVRLTRGRDIDAACGQLAARAA